MPKSVWDGEPRYVVHCLPLEESLPKVHRLKTGSVEDPGDGEYNSRILFLELPLPTLQCCLLNRLVVQNKALVAKEKHLAKPVWSNRAKKKVLSSIEPRAAINVFLK